MTAETGAGAGAIVSASADLMRRWAARLAGFCLGLVMPLAMVYANKSTPAVLGLALLFSAAALPRGHWRSEVGPALALWAHSPLGRIGALFTVWALVTIGWSVSPHASLVAFGQAIAPVLIGAGVLLLFPRVTKADAITFLLAGVVVAGALIVVDLNTDLLVRRLLGVRAENFAFNRSVVTLALLFWPLLAGLSPGGRAIIGPPLFCGMVAVVASSDSGTSVMALAAGAAAYAIALLAPRLARALAIAGVLAALAVAPIVGRLAEAVATSEMQRALSSAHTAERIAIWKAFGALVASWWRIGTGFASSGFILSDPRSASVPEALRPDLGWGHPHNIFLQIWSELGVVGVLLAAAGLAVALATSLRPGSRQLAFRTAFAVSAVAIGCVSHGAWQAWWLALVAACLAWFMVTEQRDAHMAD